ncbi:hypothetical protein BRYFOR_06623 [Marvinbryantia formatexigens DSM 14469]|uniref:DUF4440 domain-containing protein n=1 Tax=Marvinbryantia formatexigens DSM 14469 TaxID=478749 RepID=C6LCW5_9FIRM|nr:hypothetical protein BRYFOR_06623 [Marvinbryantia formatexigens DSM 14469]
MCVSGIISERYFLDISGKIKYIYKMIIYRQEEGRWLNTSVNVWAWQS